MAASFVTLMLWTTSGHFVPQVADLYVVAQYARAMAEGHPFRYNAGDAPTTGSTSLLYTAVLALVHALGARGEALVAFAIFLGVALFLASIPLASRVAARLATPREGLLAGGLVALGGPVVWSYLYGSDIALFLFLALLLLDRWLAWWAGGSATSLAAVAVLVSLARPEGLILGAALGARQPASPSRPAHRRRTAPTMGRPRRGAPDARAAARAHRQLAGHVRQRQVARGELRAGAEPRDRLQVRRRRAARPPARAVSLGGADRLLARPGRVRVPASRPRVRAARRARVTGDDRARRGRTLARGGRRGLRGGRPERLRGRPLQPLPDLGLPRPPRVRRRGPRRSHPDRRRLRPAARACPIPRGGGAVPRAREHSRPRGSRRSTRSSREGCGGAMSRWRASSGRSCRLESRSPTRRRTSSTSRATAA